MGRWTSECIFVPATVQNVQNVQNTINGKQSTTDSISFERFERFERPTGDIDIDAGVSAATPFAAALEALERRCPDHVGADRWRQAVEDGRAFLARWSEPAETVGWGEADVFGLPDVPKRPAPNYRQLSRLDVVGLAWLLRGRPVVELSADSAPIATTGGKLTFYRRAVRT